MTVKEATQKMLRRIYSKRAMTEKITDKMLANELSITPTSYSRLSNGVTEPKIMTWAKICKLHTQTFTQEETNEITNQIL